MAPIVTGSDDRELPVADKTGDYFNPATLHRAQIIRGEVIPPGYEPAADVETDGVGVDDARLQAAIAAERKATAEARAEADRATAAAKAAAEEKAELEKSKDQEIADLRKQLDAAEKKAAAAAKKPAGGAAAS